MRLVALLLLMLLSGCARGTAFAQASGAVQAPGTATVRIGGFDGDILSFNVVNESSGVMTILRDRVYMIRGGQRIYRQPGGAAREYMVPPRGHHEVKVRYRLEDPRPGESVAVHFEEALLVNGQPVPIEPIPLQVR
jgi:hypothetical protein